MSSLLEQAIVDADALRTAALKNAEAVVVSKYATQIKEAVDALLEQPEEDEETGAMLGPDSDEDVGKMPDAGQAGEELCPCPEEGEQQAFEISAKELLDAIRGEMGDEAGDGDEDMGLQEATELSDELVSQIMSSASDEEEIEEEKEFPDLTGDGEVTQADILKGRGVELDEGGAAARTGNEDRDQGRDRMRADRLHEEDEDEVDEVDEALTPQADRAKPGRRHKNPDGSPAVQEEEIEITEDNLEEVVKEFLKVDVSPVNSGWAGVPEQVAEHNAELMMAQTQDDDFKEKYEALKGAYDKIAENNSKLKQLVLVAKDKLEEVNLSNAKLLYTNDVLNSTSLNERQKNKIVEAISNTKTVEETKVIYETLQSAVGSTQKSKPQSLSEAVSKPAMSLPSRGKKKAPSPGYDRMKVLAGIMDR